MEKWRNGEKRKKRKNEKEKKMQKNGVKMIIGNSRQTNTQ